MIIRTCLAFLVTMSSLSLGTRTCICGVIRGTTSPPHKNGGGEKHSKRGSKANLGKEKKKRGANKIKRSPPGGFEKDGEPHGRLEEKEKSFLCQKTGGKSPLEEEGGPRIGEFGVEKTYQRQGGEFEEEKISRRAKYKKISDNAKFDSQNGGVPKNGMSRVKKGRGESRRGKVQGRHA